MPHRRFSRCLFAGLLAAILPAASPPQSKRPLTHNDYDGWRTIASQHLSNDGKFLAYGVFPQEGDGEVVIRNLVTGQETRIPPERGRTRRRQRRRGRPAPEARGVTIEFSADSSTLVFSTFPSKADTDKARKEKKTADQMPKDGMVIVDLASDAATTDRAREAFHLPEKAAGYLAYLREAAGERRRRDGSAATTEPAISPISKAAAAARGGRGGGGRTRRRGREFGTDLVLRTLADGAERTFSDVVEFILTEDGKQLVYAVSAHDTSKNGVFAPHRHRPTPAAAARRQGQVLQADLGREPDPDRLPERPRRSPPPSSRNGRSIAGTVSRPPPRNWSPTQTPGFRTGFVISDNGNLSFSQRWTRVYFGVAAAGARKEDDALPRRHRRKGRGGSLVATKTITSSRYRRCAPRATATAPSWPRI